MVVAAARLPPPAPLARFDPQRQVGRAVGDRIGARRDDPRRRARDWQFGFGPVTGQAGQTIPIVVQPTCLFRGEKIVAIDDAIPPGSGTEIAGFFVGNRSQLSASIPTTFLAPNNLGSGVKFDICEPSIAITMNVHFLKDCTFSAALFGKTIM